MIKKTMRIFFMTLATLVLVVLAVVPHHHHEGLWCNEVEMCAIDHDLNDEHTHHHDDSTSCVEHLNYVVSKHAVTQCNVQTLPHQFVAILTVIVYSLTPERESARACVPALDIIYTGVDVSNSHSLRAPPVA